MLYALEYVSDLGELFGSFHHLIPRCIEEPEPFEFARTVVLTIHGGLEALDGRVQESSKRWRIKRMDLIDRNILRLAAFELFEHPETPPKVVINEAVELAKKFGAEPSRSFVNGILQQLCQDNQIDLGVS